MIDNFKIIKDFIQSQWDGQFDSFTDAFYMIDIIGRAKDNASIIAHSLFKSYYIKRIEDFDKYSNEYNELVSRMRDYRDPITRK